MKQFEIDCLRRLADEKAAVAALSVQRENVGLWMATNDLRPGPPPVYINELPWHEMDYGDELTLTCEDGFARSLEQELKRELYCWRHMPGNMVVSGEMECPLVVRDSDIGISEDVDIVRTDDTSDVVSRHFNIQIRSEADIDKIKDPVVELDEQETARRFDIMQRVFGAIMPVVKVGKKGLWFTPWDNLIRLTGVTEAMMDLVDRPEYVEALVARYVQACMARMRQYNELGIWSSNNDNTRVGSGGYGYSSALAPADAHRINAPASQLWGCGNAQIFSDVSPRMHWEFSLKYELEWLKCFGLNYYGCCEALHNKLGILSRIPNLRKISMSPWADVSIAAPVARGKYVLSIKVNPAIFATDVWSPEHARADIEKLLEQSDGCAAEIILKDVSTVRYHPERVFDWARIANEVIRGKYGS